MNKFIGIGRLTKDPELRYTANKGLPVAKITIAIDNGYGENKTTDFIPVVIWGKQAENTAQYLLKGSLIAVQGRVSTRKYEHDGVTKYATEITADVHGGIKFLTTKKQNDNSNFEDKFDNIQEVDDTDMPF